MKRLILIITLFTFTAWSFAAVQVGDRFTVDYNTYEYVDVNIPPTGEPTINVKLVRCGSTGSNVVLPSAVTDPENYNCKVTALGEYLWDKGDFAKGVTGVTIPNTIETIDAYAFGDTNIEELNIPASVTKLELQNEASLLKRIFVDGGNTKYSSDSYGIVYNKAKTAVTQVPPMVVCESVDGKNTYIVPASVTQIEAWSMYLNTSLQVIKIHAGVTRCFGGDYDGGSALEAINVDAGNKNYSSQDGVLFINEGHDLGGNYPNCKALKLYPNAKRMNPEGSSELVDKKDFYAIPDGTVVILERAFLRNANLYKVTMPATVTTLQNGCFNTLPALEIVEVGAGVTSIDGNPFTICSALWKIDVNSGNENYQSIDGVLYDKTGSVLVDGKDYYPLTTLITYPYYRNLHRYNDEHGAYYHQDAAYKYEVVDGTQYIGKTAFFSVQILEVTFPESLLEIREGAFRDISEGKKLSTIRFKGNNVTTIAANAFRMCTGLWNVYTGTTPNKFPTSLQTIGDYAFYNCCLPKFEAPTSLKTIGEGAFQRNVFSIGDKGTTQVKLNSSLATIGKSAFANCGNLTKVNVDENYELTELPDNVFSNCYNETKNTGLSEINLSNFKALTTIGANAFSGDKLLQGDGDNKLLFPASLATIKAAAFSDCVELENVEFPTGSQIQKILSGAFQQCGLNDITLPEGVTEIEDNAFRTCTKLETVRIPSTTTNVSPTAFVECSSLTAFEVSESNEIYSSGDGYLLSKDKRKLVIFPAGKASSNYTLLPPSLTTIGQKSFYYCNNLKYVMIPKKVTEIQERAFYFCPNLKHITMLGAPPTSIGSEIFDNNIATRDGLEFRVREKDCTAYTSNPYWNMFTSPETSFYVQTEGTSNVDYKEEYMPMNGSDVILINSTAAVNTLVVPATVNGKSVKLIGDYAFEENTALKEVVIEAPVEYIGARAFWNSSNTIQSVFFVDNGAATDKVLSTVRFGLTNLADAGGVAYTEAKAGQKLFVRKTMTTAYTGAWPSLASHIDYQIKDINISNKYGTFAREFAVDLAVDLAANGIKMIAFTAGERAQGNGDWGNPTEYHVAMTSIYCGASLDIDGVYVPKNTGVLLKVWTDGASSGDFYYCIAEDQKNGAGYDGDNLMKGVTVDSQAITSDGTMYVMSGGQFHLVENGKTPTMPVHKAYLQLPAAAAGKMIVFDYSEDVDSPSAIDNITLDTHNDAIYTLNGTLVTSPHKGVYIKNGKKIVIR